MEKCCKEVLAQRYVMMCREMLLLTEAQSGKAERDVHQNEDYHQFSVEVLEQFFPSSFHMRKFSEGFYQEQLVKKNKKII